MKGKLTFFYDLNDEFEKEAIQDIQRGLDWKSVVEQLNVHLRNEIKYGDKEEFEPIREHLFSLLNKYNLSLD